MAILKPFFLIPFVVLLLNSYPTSGQVMKRQTELNRYDSKGLKTGHWIEYDTIAKRNITLYSASMLEQVRSPNDDVIRTYSKYDTVIAVLKKEGTYQLGKPEGVWFYKIRDMLKREITYQEGTIVKAKIYADGKLLYSGYTNNTDETFVYEQFDSKSKKISAGTIPLDLIQIESNNRIDF